MYYCKMSMVSDKYFYICKLSHSRPRGKNSRIFPLIRLPYINIGKHETDDLILNRDQKAQKKT